MNQRDSKTLLLSKFKRINGFSDRSKVVHLETAMNVSETHASTRKRKQSDSDSKLNVNNLHYFILYWKEMKKRTFGWTGKMSAPLDSNGISLSGLEEDLFVVPGVKLFSLDNCTENLEYFHTSQAMIQHLQSNPCLCQHWDDLWEQLQRAGWREEDPSSTSLTTTSNTTSDDNNSKYCFPLAAGLLGSQTVSGVHTFASQDGLEAYIGRFPYLLQDDATLAATLHAHKWSVRRVHMVEDAGHNNSADTTEYLVHWEQGVGGEASAVTCGWFSLKKTRVLLWVFPACLFRHYAADGLTRDRVMKALIVNEQDWMTPSPTLSVPRRSHQKKDRGDAALSSGGSCASSDGTNKTKTKTVYL